MFKKTHRLSSHAFTRNRKLSFSSLILFLMNLRKGAAQVELNCFLQAQQSSFLRATQTISKSAFFQARKLLSATAFIALNHQIVDEFYENTHGLKTWNGFRLCAVDGSKIRLPNKPDVIKSFGEHASRPERASCALGLASVYFDVLNRVVIDAALVPCTGAEQVSAKNHLNYADTNDLVLYDRNYNAFWFYALHQEQKLRFCLRGKIKRDAWLEAFVRSGKTEQIITLTASTGMAKLCRQHAVSSAPLQLRLIRVELDNEVEVLITNLLDQSRYQAHHFKRLYQLRWGVEELYKRMKQWVEIENFSGQSALSVEQDFHAHILSMNLTALMVIAAQKQVTKNSIDRRYNYQVNFAQALSTMKHKLVILTRNARQGITESLKLLIQIIATSTEPIRHGRSFPRKVQAQKNRLHFSCYKRAL